MTPYEDLMNKYEEVSIANSIRSVLSWDIETGKMPALGLQHRSKQFGYVTKQIQSFWKSEKIGELMENINYEQLDQIQQRNIDLIQRVYKVQNGMSTELVVDRVSHANTTNEIWKKAKVKSNFSIVKPSLQKLFELNFDYSQKLADIKDMNNPYDALIDERDEGMNCQIISKYFDQAKTFLVDFIKRHQSIDTNNVKIKNLSLPRKEEELLAELIAKSYNYIIFGDKAHGNIDEVEHPLTISCGPDDVRITVKYGNYINLMNSTHHELGHAIHKLGKNPEWNYTPINDFGSPTMGECISRYTENKIGKSYEYHVYFYDLLNELSSYRLNDYDIDDFYRVIAEICPGTQRMSADEVTYGIHIIIRFEIEQMLYREELSIDELPQVWNNKYSQYLGVDVPNDTLGIMQDLHWYSIYWGYFHGYFMGDLLGAQFHGYMDDSIDNWQEEMSIGNLNPVLNWHRDNIYQYGNLYPALDHLKHVTGENLDLKYYKSYIRNKYSGN